MPTPNLNPQIWSREKQSLANRLSAAKPTRPIRDWEIRVAAIYNWKVPAEFFSWPTETKFGEDFADDNCNADDVVVVGNDVVDGNDDVNNDVGGSGDSDNDDGDA